MGDMVLVLGGARSGKTRLAQGLAGVFSPVTFVATAQADPHDPEMMARIDRHRADRPEAWITKEVPRELEAILPGLVTGKGAVVIDCVTLWISNLMLGLGGGPELNDAEDSGDGRPRRGGRARAFHHNLGLERGGIGRGSGKRAGTPIRRPSGACKSSSGQGLRRCSSECRGAFPAVEIISL